MKNRKMLLQVLLCMVLVLSLIVPASVAGASAAGPLLDVDPVDYSVTDRSSVFSATALTTPQGNVTPMVVAALYNTVGLKSDGTVVAVGSNDLQSDAGDWMDIIQVAAGSDHTVGLKSNGTVVAVGYNEQCKVGEV